MVSFMERVLPPRAADVPGTTPLAIAKTLIEYRRAEKEHLDKIHAYLRGQQPHPFAPAGAPADVIKLAKMSRINIMDIAVAAQAQTLYVEGYRQEESGDDAAPWEVWQANRMDAAQIGVHRSALTYGVSYVTVLPGDPLPVIKGFSPRRMTAVYSDDDDVWPLWALRADPNRGKWMYRLYTPQAVHFLEGDADEGTNLKYLESREYGVAIGVTPVVRYIEEIDLDEDNVGEVEPLMQIQDQIDHTTFGLKVAEHFAAFKQRAVIGWTAASETELLKASAQRIWAFDDPDVKLHEFSETDLSGYLNSRESAIRYASVIAQMPPHYLLGQLANLSAEALVAAESGLMRKANERKMTFGESHEQTLALAGQIAGFPTTTGAQVRWKDTESRAFSATVDALTKLQSIGVPIELIIERIPGFTQLDIERAKALIESGDPLSQMTQLLDQQMRPPEEDAA